MAAAICQTHVFHHQTVLKIALQGWPHLPLHQPDLVLTYNHLVLPQPAPLRHCCTEHLSDSRINGNSNSVDPHVDELVVILLALSTR